MYFVKTPDDERGPYTVKELRNALRNGQLSDDDQVRKDSKKKYQSVKTVLQRRREAADRRIKAVAENEDDRIGRLRVGWMAPTPSTQREGYRSAAPPEGHRPTLAIFLPVTLGAALYLVVGLVVMAAPWVFRNEPPMNHPDLGWTVFVLMMAMGAMPAVSGMRLARTRLITVDDEGLTIHTRLVPTKRVIPSNEIQWVRAATTDTTVEDTEGRTFRATDDIVRMRTSEDDIDLCRVRSKLEAQRLAKTIRERLSPT